MRIRIIITIAFLLHLNSYASNMTISFLKGSFLLKREYLYFDVKITNNTNQSYIFWNIKQARYDVSNINKRSSFLKYETSGFDIDIRDSEYVRLKFKSSFGAGKPVQLPSTKLNIKNIYYICLPPNSYYIQRVIYNISHLGINRRNIYSIELRYAGVSNKDYIKLLLQLKNKNRISNQVIEYNHIIKTGKIKLLIP